VKMIGARLALARGEFRRLIDDALAAAGAPRSHSASTSDTERRLSEVCALVRRGEISRAAARLQSHCIAACTDAVESALREQFSVSSSCVLPSTDEACKVIECATPLDYQAFMETLRSAARGGGSDVMGFTYELLQGMLSCKASTGALFRFCDALATARLSEPVYEALALSKLTPAKKGKKGKLRPLMCGSTLRRLTAASLCRLDRPLMASACGPMQFAIGRSAGVEKLSCLLRTLLEAHTDSSVFLFDSISAFNHVRRDVVLRRLEEICPHLHSYAAIWLSRSSRAVLRRVDGTHSILEIKQGVDQATLWRCSCSRSRCPWTPLGTDCPPCWRRPADPRMHSALCSAFLTT